MPKKVIMRKSALAIHGSPVLTGQDGVAYAGFTVSATGGTAPRTFSVHAGSLPGGISLDASTGLVSGTPTEDGTFAGIVIRVTDALSQIADLASFDLVISAAASSWPDSSNTGYLNAPSYPGSLTAWSGGTTISGGGTAGNPQIISFQDFDGGTGGHTITGSYITFVGCRFQSNNTSDTNVRVLGGTNIIFSYCSIVPRAALVTAPPNSAWPSAGAGQQVVDTNGAAYQIDGTVSYQVGIDIRPSGGIGGPVTIDHCDIWGFGNAIIFYNTTTQMTVSSSWIHDAANATAFLYHTDGPGYLNGGVPTTNVLISGNTIASIGNTNAIAFQDATSPYDHISVTGNYLSGFGINTDMCHAVVGSTNLAFTNNVFATDLPWKSSAVRNVATLFSQPGNVWSGNKLQVLAGTAPLLGSNPQWISGQDGYFLWPDSTLHTTDF